MVPTNGGESFVRSWIRRYDEGWRDGDRAGFVVRRPGTAAFLGFASMFRLDLPAREGEIGYAVAPAARGRGVAVAGARAADGWGFDELGLERLELRIAVDEPGIRARGGARRVPLRGRAPRRCTSRRAAGSTSASGHACGETTGPHRLRCRERGGPSGARPRGGDLDGRRSDASRRFSLWLGPRGSTWRRTRTSARS